MIATSSPNLQWDTDEAKVIKPHHRAEWIEGSAIAPGIADLALESIAGFGAVVGFLNPKRLGKQRHFGYATATVKNARKHYANPIRGGWLASGHDPLADGAMVSITFKPDHARLNRDGESIKYERPLGSAPRPYFPPLDASSYKRIADRAGLTAPTFTSSWNAWLWLLGQPAVELCIDEGEKKAAAACSHGWLTIGLAGIWNGAPRPRDAKGEAFGSHTLIAELQWLKGIRPKDAALTVAFDASDKARGRIAIRNARRVLGRLLAAEGHQIWIRDIELLEGDDFLKGTDDVLVAGGADALEAMPVEQFDAWLKNSSEKAIRDHLLHPYSVKKRIHCDIARHFTSADIPLAETAGLIALIGGMGSNKTGAVADYSRNQKLVSFTHRRSLADNQGHRFGLIVKREGQFLHAFKQADVGVDVATALAAEEGFIVCADSSYIGGSGELQPDQCRGAVLFIDEADALLRHCLMAGTAIQGKRCEVLTNLANCVAAADQVVLAGAHIDETTLRAFETMRGAPAFLIQSTFKPAAGCEVTLHRKEERLLQEVRNLATHHKPFLFHTGSKQVSSRFGPAAIARFIRKWWPDARILELTSNTIRDPQHPASKAINDPQRLLAFDVVLASPVLETGFSIEDPDQHFSAVVGHTNGHTLPTAFVQSLGRLRSNVPRHIWCGHSGARIGNGAPNAAEVERLQLEHAQRITMLHLHEADAASASSNFVHWWSQLAAAQNWAGMHYRFAVATLLEREGYCVERLDELDVGKDLLDALSDERDAVVSEDTAAVAAAPAVSAEQLAELEERKRLTLEQRRMRERGRIARDLGIDSPTAEQVEVSRDKAKGRLLQHLLLVDPEARQQWRANTLQSLTASQRSFAPDLTAAVSTANRADVLDHMPWLRELLSLVGTGNTITMDSFAAAHESAQADGARWRVLFGFDPRRGTVRTFVNDLLRTMGFKLQRTKRRSTAADGVRVSHYEVVDLLKVLDRSTAQASIKAGIANTGLGTKTV